MYERIAALLGNQVTIDGDCWVWTGPVTGRGYGRMYWRGEQCLTHRLVYIEVCGPVPEGLVLDHLCRNHRCVNPAHIEPVTNKEDIIRGISFSAINARKTRCKHGHEFTSENTIIRQKPDRADSRQCRTCYIERKRRLRRREAAALTG